MPNASTIRRQISGTQQLTIAPLSGTVITTTETPFSLNNNGLTLTGGGIIPLSAGVTGLYQGTGQVLWIHAAGTATGMTGGSTTLALSLQQVPAASLPFASTVVTTANMATAGASDVFDTSTVAAASGQTAGSFQFDAWIQLDAQGNLTGDFQSQIFGGTTQAKTATTTVTGLVGEQDLNFVVSATLGVAEVGVVLTLNEFSLSFV
jgi:hypothetical protein